MLRSNRLIRSVIDVKSCLPSVIVPFRGYNQEYDHAQLKVTHPDIPEFEKKDNERHRFKDHRTRLQSEWKENRNQGVDPLLERLKAENAHPQTKLEESLLQDFSPLDGVPADQKFRQVRIFSQARNAMQSGSFATRKWRIQFDNQERWENPNMGWTSSADPHSGLHVEFTSAEDAIAYCKRNGYRYSYEPKAIPHIKAKSYAANFAWNKNTRVPAK